MKYKKQKSLYLLEQAIEYYDHVGKSFSIYLELRRSYNKLNNIYNNYLLTTKEIVEMTKTKYEYYNDKKYRPLTREEILALGYGSHVLVVSDNGDPRVYNCKITSVETWKRKYKKIVIHMKYGLYTYPTTDYLENNTFYGPMLVKLIDDSDKTSVVSN